MPSTIEEEHLNVKYSFFIQLFYGNVVKNGW